MKTYVDLWDYFFGKWEELCIPLPNGTFKKVAATEKWLKTMEAAGALQRTDETVIRAHILDLASDLIQENALLEEEILTGRIPPPVVATRPSPMVEYWEVGKQISLDAYLKAKDPATGDLYVLFQNMGGKKVPLFGTRERWEHVVKLWQSSH